MLAVQISKTRPNSKFYMGALTQNSDFSKMRKVMFSHLSAQSRKSSNQVFHMLLKRVVRENFENISLMHATHMPCASPLQHQLQSAFRHSHRMVCADATGRMCGCSLCVWLRSLQVCKVSLGLNRVRFHFLCQKSSLVPAGRQVDSSHIWQLNVQLPTVASKSQTCSRYDPCTAVLC